MANQQTKIDNSLTEVRSNHNLSFNWLGSADYGRIVPFHWQELVATDHVKTLKPRIEMQMLPIASPSFGKMSIYVHYFAVPIRLLWNEAYDFFSQTGKGKNAIPPYWTGEDFQVASDYGDNGSLDEWETGIWLGSRGLYKHWTSFGLPPFWRGSNLPNGQQGYYGIGENDKISLLPFRAYNQVWWDFYRDPELVPDDNIDFHIRRTSGREKNYNESGSNVIMEKENIYVPRVRSIKDVWFSQLFASNGTTPYNIYLGDRTLSNSGTSAQPIITSEDGEHARNHRRAEALTRMAERLSLSGKRQIDMLYTQYGVKPQFSKLNMAQYIGGGKSDVLITDITSSADTALPEAGLDGKPLGSKAGQGYCQLSDIDIDFTASEPTILLGVFSIMPKVHFVQGLGKEWYRNTLTDFFKRELEHIGQVAVPKKEVGVNYFGFDVTPSAGTEQRPYYSVENNDKTFAFTQPYYEYKRKCDVLAGDFMYYHTKTSLTDDNPDIAYMQSMNLFVDYPDDREFTAENMQLPAAALNKLFFYQGGSVWDNVDDHFHVDIDVECIINRPMDGYAIPTLETTENPHASTAPIGNSVQL
ncbi:MAG: hypothetical protein J6Q60_03865 [Bacteroidaceae bacterium]|nr:hypothetical protein [Bacteroidaceae bacterium]